MGSNRRREIRLSLTADQFDDLASALEAHRDGFERLAEEAGNGFGLPEAYWNGRVDEVQQLLDAVHRPAAGDASGLREEDGSGRTWGQAG